MMPQGKGGLVVAAPKDVRLIGLSVSPCWAGCSMAESFAGVFLVMVQVTVNYQGRLSFMVRMELANT